LTWGFAIFAIFWLVLSAFGGCTLTYFWLFTDHAAVRPNENILQLSPLALPMIVLVPMLLRRKPRAGRNTIALALPTNAGLAWAVWRLNRTLPGKGSTL
jgi:hypothetical protein